MRTWNSYCEKTNLDKKMFNLLGFLFYTRSHVLYTLSYNLIKQLITNNNLIHSGLRQGHNYVLFNYVDPALDRIERYLIIELGRVHKITKGRSCLFFGHWWAQSSEFRTRSASDRMYRVCADTVMWEEEWCQYFLQRWAEFRPLIFKWTIIINQKEMWLLYSWIY